MPKIGAWRLVANSQKPAIGGPFCEYQGHVLWAPDCLAGAGGFELQYGELESDALACPRRGPKTPFVEIRRPLEMLEFREPYRIGGVQSFGDEWVFRRIMSAPGRGRVLSSNEKSPPLLGLMHTSSRREYAASVKGGGASEIRTRGTVKVPVVSYVCSDFRLRAVFASLLCCWSRCTLHNPP
jgi:hypothetical protein